MSLPLRSLLALAVVAVLAALIARVVYLLWSRPRSAAVWALLSGAIVVLTTIALWIVFVLPAYWD